MKRREFLVMSAVGGAVLGLSACGSSKSGGSGAEGDTIVVGYSQLGAESGWRTANTEDIKKHLTAENGFDLTFVDAQQKQENQIKALRDFISQDVDIVAFSPVVETGWDDVLQELKDAEIPVILVDRSVDTTVEDPYVAHIGSDMAAEGKMAGEWVQENFPNAKIFELQGTMGSGPQVDREAAFDAIMGDNVIGKATGNFTRAEGKTAMEAALQAYPDMDLVFSHNDDMGLGAIEAIEAAGKKPGTDIAIVTVDGVKDGLQALVDKKFNYVVECNPIFGEQLGELMKKVVAGEEVEKNTVVEDKTFDQTITQEEVDARPY
ncbi:MULTISPECIES: ABC transporter substrate-binding protein [Actinomyces]|jgi:ABC-type sugar transport system substrate-binding protein|uniref:Twin-arginine translocation pathway signal sequence bacterial/archaeal n=1 Tax=Actinomyces glycerinitolerans TaxID=1892869 RepID=A0A1M4RWS6_9ACTO|nr:MULTISPECIES: ABC transporter substrate-binding protein [Actinomyces]MBM6980233.1 ABC transporter substrate-binding protein [Actinomyces succiniciruminis]RAX21432.1 LacI family transcriptional regulator [Actinomyces sp. Z5]RAX21471.1 LacI family transcriptional regulator [Actinomyces sp. Z3]SHE24426.1 twin-arginine translocation pathway signal sequence bacterial/archaeal [Actinomyces glycerinitolerans]